MTDATARRAAPAIELTGIRKRFGTLSALDGATLTAQLGSVHALLGENGAGKTTLMRIAFGMIRPDAGQLLILGRPVAWKAPADAILAGIGMVHQHFTLVPAMTVAENVELGAGSSGSRTGRWRFDRRRAEEGVRELGRASGLTVEPGALVDALSVATQQRVEILKALSRAAKILILDEPTAVLAPKESDDLLRWLRSYTASGGTAILITHKLRDALAVADDVTVLRRGRTVLTARRSETDEAALTRAMIGDESTAATRRVAAAEGSRQRSASSASSAVAVLEEIVARDPERRETIRATLTVHAGELVGIAGVDGAGQHSLLRVLAGRIQPSAGRLARPEDVGFVPEDRHRDGLVLEFSLTKNVALRGAGSRRGRMPWADIHRRTAALMQDFDVRAAATGPQTPARALSGGNQQRFILARELDGRPPLLIAENPTRGLDVRATADIHDRLRAACREGTAVVFYSSDLDEVLALATRIIAVHAGTVREVPADREVVGRAILGLS